MMEETPKEAEEMVVPEKEKDAPKQDDEQGDKEFTHLTRNFAKGGFSGYSRAKEFVRFFNGDDQWMGLICFVFGLQISTRLTLVRIA